MMKCFLTILVFAFLCTAGAVQGADESADKRPSRDDLKKLSPEEREARLKERRKTNGAPSREEWEKKREQFKNMTPEEREAKRKELTERLDKRIAELRAKQTNATITPQETRELERREQILKRFQQGPPPGAKIERPARREPAAPPPPEK